MEGFLSRDAAVGPTSSEGDPKRWLESLPAALRAEVVRQGIVDLAHHSASGAVGVVILLALVLAGSPYLQDHPALARAVAAGAAVAVALRLWAARVLRPDVGDDAAARWGAS